MASTSQSFPAKDVHLTVAARPYFPIRQASKPVTNASKSCSKDISLDISVLALISWTEKNLACGWSWQGKFDALFSYAFHMLTNKPIFTHTINQQIDPYVRGIQMSFLCYLHFELLMNKLSLS